MQITMLNGKIHRATVTQAEVDYIGSITIDPVLLEAAGIHEYERVQVVDINNGNRLETYVIKGEPDSGMICLNGAAAHCCDIGDRIIIMSYCILGESEIKEHTPKVVFVNGDNKIVSKKDCEKFGTVFESEA